VSAHPALRLRNSPTKAKSMYSDEYYRLHITCFVMARQSDLADVRTRGLNMAQACLKLANTDGMQVASGSRKRKLEGVQRKTSHQQRADKPMARTARTLFTSGIIDVPRRDDS
jgi:hypothetical protein